jgi:hypothetical protein
MKKTITLFAALFLTVASIAQNTNKTSQTAVPINSFPQKMSYQALIRDVSNALVVNQAVGMQISILQGSASGTAVYQETQTLTTNANGLVSLEIGTGTVVSGTFAAIEWFTGTYFIKTETDPTVGGTNYTITGTSQLMSVPYALHAKTAESALLETQNVEQVLTMGNNANGKNLLNTGKIGIGTPTPAASTALDITSTTGAVLLPRMTIVQRDALTPTPGMMIFNTNTGTIQGYHKQTLYDYPDQFNYEDWGITPTKTSLAQAFVPSGDGQLRSVVVLYAGLGGSPGDLIIHNGAGTGGTIIAMQPITIPYGSDGMTMEFTLNTPVSLIGGNTYTFEIRSYGSLRLHSSPSFTYWPGNSYYDGVASSEDLYFITKMDVTSNITKWNDL